MNFEQIKQAAFVDELEKIAEGNDDYQKVKGSKNQYIEGHILGEALKNPELMGEITEKGHKGALKGLGIGSAIGGGLGAAIMLGGALKGSGLKSGIQSAMKNKTFKDRAKAALQAIKNTKLQSKYLPETGIAAANTLLAGSAIGAGLGEVKGTEKLKNEFLQQRGLKQDWLGRYSANAEARKKYNL
jgi:hypothetical protein